jgi:Tol biopolymer transport system component
VVDSDPQVSLPLDFPPTSSTPSETQALTRLTTDEASEVGAKWSPDGSRLVFESTRDGSSDLWLIRLD